MGTVRAFANKMLRLISCPFSLLNRCWRARTMPSVPTRVIRKSLPRSISVNMLVMLFASTFATIMPPKELSGLFMRMLTGKVLHAGLRVHERFPDKDPTFLLLGMDLKILLLENAGRTPENSPGCHQGSGLIIQIQII